MRWYDYLQHTLGLTQLLPLVKIVRPAYVAPPPPPPPAPKVCDMTWLLLATHTLPPMLS
jgi:hypothetical protein